MMYARYPEWLQQILWRPDQKELPRHRLRFAADAAGAVVAEPYGMEAASPAVITVDGKGVRCMFDSGNPSVGRVDSEIAHVHALGRLDL